MNIQSIKQKITPTLRREGVEKAAIFGSYARGTNKKNSDIDILVKMKRGKTLYDLIGLQLSLEKKLNKSVDVVTYDSLHPRLHQSALASQKVIYEKRSQRVSSAHSRKH